MGHLHGPLTELRRSDDPLRHLKYIHQSEQFAGVLRQAGRVVERKRFRTGVCLR
jgi:hypothetical protein